MTVTYLLRRGTGSASLPVVAPEALPTLVQDKLRHTVAVRCCPGGEDTCLALLHLYHQDARFQRQQRPLSRQTVSALKGRITSSPPSRTGRGWQSPSAPT